MTIFLLNGSPRGERSLSLQLSREFIEGLQQERARRGAEPAEILETHLVSADIRSCTGCFSCWKGPDGRCPLNDEMRTLLPQYRAADLVLWSMPLYHFGMPALMKRFLERTLPEVSGTIIDDEKGSFTHPLKTEKRTAPAASGALRNILISTCGFPSRKNNYEALHAHLDQLIGAHQWERIECVEGELLGIPAMTAFTGPYREAVRRAGAEWGATLSDGRPWTGFSSELRARLDTPMVEEQTFLKLANANWGVASPSAAQSPSGDPAKPDGLTAKQNEAAIFLSQMAILYNPAKGPPGPALLEMHFTDLERSWFLAMENERCTVTDSAAGRPVTTAIHTTYELWQQIGRGEVDGSTAMMRGQYRISGETDLLMRMADGLFGGPTAPDQHGTPDAKDDTAAHGVSAGHRASGAQPKPLPMFFGLLPWIIGWIALPLAERIPILWSLTLMLSAAALILSRAAGRNTGTGSTTWFERINPLCMSVFLILGLIFPDSIKSYGAPLLYAASALVWALSTVQRPLTSDYSAPDYPLAIRSHPIFVDTNRIMTAFWAAVYAVQAALALLLGISALRPFTGLILQALLLPAALFTNWFPAWYSRRRMSGNK